MKYTKSKDGVDRLTINIALRLSKNDLESLKPIAQYHGYASVTKFVRDMASQAWDYWVADQREANEGSTMFDDKD
jgi:hypothetical protein